MEFENFDDLIALGDDWLSFALADEEYKRLYNQGLFKEALNKVEQILAARSGDLSVRIAWIACQLNLGEVPITALSSPLEDIVQNLENDENLYKQSFGLFLLMGIKLIRRDKMRLAVLELERAFEIGTKAKIDLHVMNKLQNLLISALTEEIVRAEKRREDKLYIEGLKQSKEKYSLSTRLIDKIKPETAFEELKSIKHGRKRFFNSKALVAEIKTTDEKWILDDNSINTQEDIGIVPHKSKSSRNFFVFLLAGMILTGVFLFSSRVDNNELIARLVVHAETETSNNMLPPNIMRHQERTDEAGSIAALQLKQVKERLERKSEDEKSAPLENPQIPVAHKAKESHIPSEKAAVIKDIQEDLHRQEEVVSQIEKLGFDRPSKEIEAKMPSIQIPQDDKPKIESLDTKDGRIETSGLKMKSDGRIYGPPRELADKGIDDDQKGLEVKQFQLPVLYKIIARTKVLSAPSAVSYTVGELEVGSKIHVVTQIGPWLELVSVQGRKGYLYAQDAEYQGPVRDKGASEGLKGLE